MWRYVGLVRYGFILLFIKCANGFWDNAKVVQVGVGRKSMMCAQPKEIFDFVWNFFASKSSYDETDWEGVVSEYGGRI